MTIMNKTAAAAKRLITIAVAIVLLACALYIFRDSRHFSLIFTSATLALFLLLCVFALQLENKKVFWAITIFALALLFRLAALRIWRIQLSSDALDNFELARKLAAQPVSNWKNAISMTRHAYEYSIHLPYVIYESLVLRLFGSIQALSLANALWSALSALTVYAIAAQIFGVSRRASLAGLLFALNPTSVLFADATYNQHIATFLFLLAIYFYLRAKPGKFAPINALLCGVFLAASHIMRPEMTIVLIAVVCVGVYEIFKGKNIKAAVIKTLLIAVVFLALTRVSNAAVGSLAREAPSGMLKYKIAVGLNAEAEGKWNAADFEYVGADANFDEIIAERLSVGVGSLSKLLAKKVLFQFSSYDYWNLHYDLHGLLIPGGSVQTLLAKYAFYPTTQGFAFLLLVFSVISLLWKKSKPPLILAVTLLGYIAAFAIVEVQQRYNYIIIPLLSILAADGANSALLPKGRETLDKIKSNKIVVAVFYFIMLAMALAFFTGEGKFIYEAF